MFILMYHKQNYDLNSSNFDDERGMWWRQNCLLWISCPKASFDASFDEVEFSVRYQTPCGVHVVQNMETSPAWSSIILYIYQISLCTGFVATIYLS